MCNRKKDVAEINIRIRVHIGKQVLKTFFNLKEAHKPGGVHLMVVLIRTIFRQ